METVNNINILLSSDITREIPTDGRTAGEFRFLESNTAAPFAVRFARELAAAANDIRHAPVTFIGWSLEGSTILPDRRKRMKAGLMVAVAFYALALFGIYASDSFVHGTKTKAEPIRHLEITYLASRPMPVKKAVPQLKEAAGMTGRDQLASPIKRANQPMAELMEAKPTPHLPDQPRTTEYTTPTSNSPTGETASRVSAPDGGARGLTGNGVGTASDGAHGGASSSDVNYNDVFSISRVTTRPQILARPIPGYTEQARRAQVEGVVKLSVVLNSNGTVSDITVVRGIGYGLDEKAIAAARELRFVAANKDGHIVSVRVFLEFRFTLL
ncbi:MAG TPA: TonB family protein [Blastocatellia bacterium]